jgi:hypothetical protein
MKDEMPELLRMVVKQVKEVARIGESPMGFINKEDGTMILQCFLVPKDQIKLALYLFSKDTKEVCFCSDSFYLDYPTGKTPEIPIREHPQRKEAFVVSYFTPDKEISVILPYKRKKSLSKPIWSEEIVSLDAESTFNPFKLSKQDVRKILVNSEIEELRSSGKKEVIKLSKGFRIEVYRYKGKVFFETYNDKNECFGRCEPTEDNQDFQDKLNSAIAILKLVGGQINGDL